MVDDEAFVTELGVDTPVAVTPKVPRVYVLYAFTLVDVMFRFLLKVVVICGAGQPASLQEMPECVIAAQFVDDLGPIPNISAFSSWSRAFNFFR